jgi:hypothetical protein
LNELAERELQSEREHQQDHAQLGQRAHGRSVRHERNRDVRSDYHAGEEVTEDNRLMEALEDDCCHRCYAQHDGEILKKQVRIHKRQFTPYISSRLAPENKKAALARRPFFPL